MNRFSKSFVLVALITSVSCQASSKQIECERYKVAEQRKIERSVAVIHTSPNEDALEVAQAASHDWPAPDGAVFNIRWKSDSGLRQIGEWIATDYGDNNKRWSPVYLIDVDFSRPMTRRHSLGGFSDHDKLISDPWFTECRRLD